MIVIALLAVAAVLLQATHGAVLTAVSPVRGSYAGGTQITIRGAGLSSGGVAVRGLAPIHHPSICGTLCNAFHAALLPPHAAPVPLPWS
jgi:hypothetical protein